MSSSVVRWLWAIYAMVFAMVIVGGITRLTGSGLSMVEWHPLMGALPPLNDAAWAETFAKYQATPQYREVNHWMTLADFQRIFFWEYFHRLLGRLIGVVFFVPWVVFAVRGRLGPRDLKRTFIAFLLGGAQGVLGWFMVKSGLVDVPEVSHFRLAAHLSLAFFVGHYVLWLILDAKQVRELGASAPSAKTVRHGALIFLGVLVVQIVWGAFMAGKRAGWLFQTFPDMNGSMFPRSPSESSLLAAILESPVEIHAMHRTLAWLVLVGGLALWYVAKRDQESPRQRRAALLLLAAVKTQFVLGVLTVMLGVPVAIAVAHQGCAFLLLSATVNLLHAFRRA